MIRFAFVFAVVAWPAASRSEPAGAQAEVLFRQGRDLMDAGNFAGACTAFEESEKLEPAVATLLNLASCREKLGQVATAWGLFLNAERQTRSAHDAATQRLHEVAQRHAQKLEPRVSKLTIKVPFTSQLKGLEIARGRDRVDSVMWNRSLPIDGGTYSVTARAPGANVWTTQVTIAAESDTKIIEIPDLRIIPRDLSEPSASKSTVAATGQPTPTSPQVASATLSSKAALPAAAAASGLPTAAPESPPQVTNSANTTPSEPVDLANHPPDTNRGDKSAGESLRTASVANESPTQQRGSRTQYMPIVSSTAGVAALVSGGVLIYKGQQDGPDDRRRYTRATAIGIGTEIVGVAAIAYAAYLWGRGPKANGLAITAIPGGLVAGWSDTF